MVRTKTAIQIFIEFWRKENREPTLEEFNSEWNGGKRYYYQVRARFHEEFDELIMRGEI